MLFTSSIHHCSEMWMQWCPVADSVPWAGPYYEDNQKSVNIINKQLNPPLPNFEIMGPTGFLKKSRFAMIFNQSLLRFHISKTLNVNFRFLSCCILMFAVIRWDYFIVPYGSLCLPKFSFFCCCFVKYYARLFLQPHHHVQSSVRRG